MIMLHQLVLCSYNEIPGVINFKEKRFQITVLEVPVGIHLCFGPVVTQYFYCMRTSQDKHHEARKKLKNGGKDLDPKVDQYLCLE